MDWYVRANAGLGWCWVTQEDGQHTPQDFFVVVDGGGGQREFCAMHDRLFLAVFAHPFLPYVSSRERPTMTGVVYVLCL